jgi:hypothetical protein
MARLDSRLSVRVDPAIAVTRRCALWSLPADDHARLSMLLAMTWIVPTVVRFHRAPGRPG